MGLNTSEFNELPQLPKPEAQEPLAELDSSASRGHEDGDVHREAPDATKNELPSERLSQQPQPPPTISPPSDDTPVDDEVSNIVGQTPGAAGDADKIEPVWVKKFEDVRGKTKHDPRQQERVVNRLRVDYQGKRYKREQGQAA